MSGPVQRRGDVVDGAPGGVPEGDRLRSGTEDGSRRARHHVAKRAAEDPTEVLDRAALRAEPGRQHRPVDVQVFTGEPDGRSHDGADGAETGGRPVACGDRGQDVARYGATGAGSCLLDRCALGVGGQCEDEDPASVADSGVDPGSSDPNPG